MRVLSSLKDKAIELISEPAEYEPVINERCNMATKKDGKLVKFNTRRGEVRFHTDKPEQAPAPAPEPAPARAPQRAIPYYPPQISRRLPRITPKTPRLLR